MGDLGPGSRGRDVVGRRLEALAGRLAEAVPAARRDEPDGVHRTRTTCRRLRAVLAVYRPLLDREVTEPVRADLQWLARSLGGRRDADVVGDRVAELLSDEPARLVHGPARRRAADHRRARRQRTQGASEPLLSARCERLLDGVARLAADPPWTARAGGPARKVVRKRLRREVRRVEARLAVVPDPGPGAAAAAERDEALHDVRKAAKRLRYAAEVARPAFGRDAKRLGRRATRLTAALGRRQDAVEVMATLRDLAREAERAGEPSFTWGRLHAREESAAREVEDALPGLWREVRRDEVAGWLG